MKVKMKRATFAALGGMFSVIAVTGIARSVETGAYIPTFLISVAILGLGIYLFYNAVT